jgi:hypothetical protein
VCHCWCQPWLSHLLLLLLLLLLPLLLLLLVALLRHLVVWDWAHWHVLSPAAAAAAVGTSVWCAGGLLA